MRGDGKSRRVLAAQRISSALTTASSSRAQRAERAGRALLDLTESNPTRAQLAAARARASARSISRTRACTSPSRSGYAAAREAASAWMARQARRCACAPEHIVLTASTSEAYAFLFKLLCDAGDEVLVPAPSYPLFAHLAQLEDVRVVSYPLALRRALAHHGRRAARARARRARARSSSCTRTTRPARSSSATSSRSSRALGLPIISDEVFAPYPLRADPTRAPSALCAEERARLQLARAVEARRRCRSSSCRSCASADRARSSTKRWRGSS